MVAPQEKYKEEKESNNNLSAGKSSVLMEPNATQMISF